MTESQRQGRCEAILAELPVFPHYDPQSRAVKPTEHYARSSTCGHRYAFDQEWQRKQRDARQVAAAWIREAMGNIEWHFSLGTDQSTQRYRRCNAMLDLNEFVQMHPMGSLSVRLEDRVANDVPPCFNQSTPPQPNDCTLEDIPRYPHMTLDPEAPNKPCQAYYTPTNEFSPQGLHDWYAAELPAYWYLRRGEHMLRVEADSLQLIFWACDRTNRLLRSVTIGWNRGGSISLRTTDADPQEGGGDCGSFVVLGAAPARASGGAIQRYEIIQLEESLDDLDVRIQDAEQAVADAHATRREHAEVFAWVQEHLPRVMTGVEDDEGEWYVPLDVLPSPDTPEDARTPPEVLRHLRTQPPLSAETLRQRDMLLARYRDGSHTARQYVHETIHRLPDPVIRGKYGESYGHSAPTSRSEFRNASEATERLVELFEAWEYQLELDALRIQQAQDALAQLRAEYRAAASDLYDARHR